MRANYPFGEVASANYTTANGAMRGASAISAYSGNVFEPADIYKGDFARIYFYMATRYENQIANWENYSSYGDAALDGSSFPCYEQWYLDMLVKWHLNDPVSQKEAKRNDEVYSIQGNRNPYVDHPEYVMKVWGNQLSVKPEPTNYPQNFTVDSAAPASVKVNWNDATGMVVPDGYLIKANTAGSFNAPADGSSQAEDLNLTDGDALVRVLQGKETFTFQGLDTIKTWYFSIWPYTNSGNDIDYKTSPAAPVDSVKYDVGSAVEEIHQDEFISEPHAWEKGLAFESFSGSPIDISVYNLNGQLLRIIRYAAGRQSVKLNLSGLSADVLIIRIKNKDHRKILKYRK
jgi:hypothetical protein